MSGLALCLVILAATCVLAALGARAQGCEKRDVLALLGFGAGAGAVAAPLLF
ncbi:hypothetical protein KGH30_20175 [Bordetella hinzii]|uniref:hypothetical protein n=1 Tax=Bordetella hinzii TaxID=103855 RepID=UPI00040603C6|nr:hypothetical protein [Bordetella hinzii]AKQ55626.1 hypothetical protein ACR54_02311 [Bordetella hinzii]AKQ60128.1 hypothetical protein ACR55_02260 [Bordetella hinzii]KCB26700.1 hypothetical protein L541_2278 [Bordetella hinzii CA90 BAL1384]KCB33207.1 hypothetical protein L543_2188 [Bordetella hinzii L60]KCB51089.1 hypothetical protein L537_2319 [Bordetella hinzii 1277]